MKKIASAVMAGLLAFTLLSGPQAQAASTIKIYIDGAELATDQAPVVSSNHVLVPLRGIFEALHATVLWNQQTQTVTALKDGSVVVLRLGSKTATINGQTVSLETPATSLNGRTLVPVRFVSEALGQNVEWQPSTRQVVITTDGNSGNSGNVDSVSYVSAAVSGQNGNGSDVQVNFERPSNTANIAEYRILVVKDSSAASFTYAKAQSVSSTNYTVVSVNDGDRSVYLSSQARDVDGNLISVSNSYRVFVLTVGKNGGYALSASSSAFSLSGKTVQAASNVKLSDVGNNGDGRDLSVSFAKAQSETNISGYRIFIVKTANAANFTLAAANAASSQYYTSVGKTGSTITTQLSSSTRDTSGEYIKNGVSYTAFVLSVSSSSGTASKLSAASSALTLTTTNSAPVISRVDDVNDYGDGRDLQIIFSRSSDESKVSYYRVFVVRAGDANSFTLNTANAAASGRYYDVSKSGSGLITASLPSNMKDVSGSSIVSGVSYRLFVMAVSSNSSAYPNGLSAPSAAITLSNGVVGSVSNLYANDISDYGDGRDLLVSFTRASDESSISHYRIFVVKTSLTGSFDKNKANSLSSSYYTYVSANGNNQSLVLGQSALTSDGSRITNDTSYRVYVLSVAKNGNSNNNVLSGGSAVITLNGTAVSPVSSLGVTDIADYGNGNDLQVTFNKPANEANINHYRIFVVKSSDVSSFNADKAYSLSGSLYTYISKTGGNQTIPLGSNTRSTDGAYVTKGQSYRIFVLSVGNSGTYSLSSASASITLTDNITIGAVSNLIVDDTADNGNGSDLRVSFSKAPNESNISSYRIFVVPDSQAGNFKLANANAATSSYYTQVSKTGRDLSLNLNRGQVDVNGAPIQNGVTYRVFVLSVGVQGYSGNNALSAASASVTLSNNLTISPASGVNAILDTTDNVSLTVSFSRSDSESLIAEYRVIVVPKDKDLSVNAASAIDNSGYLSTGTGGGSTVSLKISRDYQGNALQSGVEYKAYVLAVSKGTMANAVSGPSQSVAIPAAQAADPANNGTNQSSDSGQGEPSTP